ncbi:MAG: ABC transporter ATP-binding protein [Neisseriaceae bacterium]
MEHNLVSIENVNFSYDDTNFILNGISLNIPRGKIVAIMGGSGSGKTTLLRLITGQNKAQSGKIKVFGQHIDKLSNNQLLHMRKRMGMLFQFGALFTDMSVLDNVAFSLREHTNLPENLIKKIVAMKLNAVGLFGTQDMYPSELSGGMSRRIALARSIVLDPELMLYDEPFTGLDPISLNVISMLIKKLNDTLGQTSILVTHDIQASLKIVDYIYFMANGKIIASGTPQEVVNSDNPAVRQFINGEVSGPFNYEYPSNLNYNKYLGIE